MKAFVLILNAGCVITSFWFIIVAQQYVRFSKGEHSTGRRLLYFYTLVDLSASCMNITSELSNFTDLSLPQHIKCNKKMWQLRMHCNLKATGCPCSSPIDNSELWWLSGGKRRDYQNCSVLYCVLKLYTVISTLRWAVLTVLWIGFCLTGPISVYLDSFVFFGINFHRHEGTV